MSSLRDTIDVSREAIYNRSDKTKDALLHVETPEELEVKLREMMGDGAENFLPVTTAYQLFAHKLDLRWLRVIALYMSIIELIPYDINHHYSFQGIPRHLHTYAAVEGAVDVLRYLLEAGIDVNNFYSAGRSMLHEACWWGHIEMVEILLQHNANPSLLDSRGETPVHHAVSRDKIAIIDRLYLAGAPFNDCHPQHHSVAPETLVRLIDLRVLQGTDLVRVLSPPSYLVRSYNRFFQVYNILYNREDNGKKEAYRYLAGTLEQLYAMGKGVRQNLKNLIGHFMAQYMLSEERDEVLRQILLPYLHIQGVVGGCFNGTTQSMCVPGIEERVCDRISSRAPEFNK